MKHHVVLLDGWLRFPAFDFDHKITRYEGSQLEDLPERMKDATIVVTSGTRIDRAGIESAPNLQLVACNGTGTDHIDGDAIRERGVALCHVPAQNTESVTEHAFALYFSLRRQIIPMHNATVAGEAWHKERSLHVRISQPPRSNKEETLVVVGYGALGRNIEKMGRALEMRVLVAERKTSDVLREGRVPFEEALTQGTLFIIVTPLDSGTRDMFTAKEFGKMDSSAIVVNVGRGGVLNEVDLVEALRSGQIGGAATDVFEHEPATKEKCPLLDPSIPNLVLSPHIAWYSLQTIQRTVATAKANLEAFAHGRPQNLVIPGRPN